MRKVKPIGPVGRHVIARLDALRLERHMSQISLRDGLEDAGCKLSAMTVWRILSGQRSITVDELDTFGRVLNVHPALLLSEPVSSAEVWKAMS